ncbi:signal recognition particle [Niveomyces insectorum RCEF 264]|uniref:Signal recognition particle subunit SRP72 n=1 Tax=Niveomyces insectorum RCEF 264 TaxID=1081102 RepID=A0A167X5C9_9HYPO|nr:signal recognition particle [Niveomyces insectorum RCEF 264]
MATSAVNALNSLLRGTSIDDHDEALKLADAAIQAAKAGGGSSGGVDTLTAQHTKVVALLKLDRFDDALRTVAAAGDALAARCVLERAYALYKTGDLDAAAALYDEDSNAKHTGDAPTTTTAAAAHRLRALQHVAAQGVRNRTTKQLKQQQQAAAAAAPGDDDNDNDDDTAAHAVLPAVVDLGVAHAAATAELQTGKEALRRILPQLAHRPDDVGLLLTAVQLLGRHQAARAEVARAVAHWQNKGSHKSDNERQTNAAAPASLLRAAGIELLQSPHVADQAAAAAAFEELHAANPSDRIAAAGLVASLAAATATQTAAAADAGTDVQAAQVVARQRELAASLTPVDQLVKGIDVASLLSGGVATLAPPSSSSSAATSKKRGAPAAGASASAAAAAAEGQPSTKKAKTAAAGGKPPSKDSAAVPKLSRQARRLQAKAAAANAAAGGGGGSATTSTFDPNKKPDPERWLPLRDRSSYRPPKGKKGARRRNEAANMQGGVVKEEETLALAGGAGSVKVEKALPGAGGGGAAKKRKKGKK